MKHTYPVHLSQEQVEVRKIQFGKNEILEQKRETLFKLIFVFFKEPMQLLLVITSLVYLLMGDVKESIMLGISVLMVMGISFYQSRKSSRAMEKLKEISSPRAFVVRNGQEIRIPAVDVVPGDLALLNEGDRVPADGIVIESYGLSVDEALLTGESFPVNKMAGKELLGLDVPEELFFQIENREKVFSSTLVVRGRAQVRVVRTGVNTEVGSIGQSLQSIKPIETNLSVEIKKLVKIFAVSGVLVCVILTLAYGFLQKDWLNAFLMGLATQMSLLPEEFPVVLTLFMALGAWRLSLGKVLVRTPTAIERLGAITVLCVDKTGTLTQNQMRVQKLHDGDSLFSREINDLTNAHQNVLQFAALASSKLPFDPMEKAICELANQKIENFENFKNDLVLVKEYPLTEKTLAMTCVWAQTKEISKIVAMKGAPETVLKYCDLSEQRKSEILEIVQKMAHGGLRVLGVARTEVSQCPLPAEQELFKFEWAGLVGLEDPLREEVPQAVRLCKRAGIRVMMMTGDYAETAQSIALRAGIDCSGPVLTGSEIQSMDDKVLLSKLKSTQVFARMIPSQKLRLVESLKKSGEVVGMTGDGVNDAPSLKFADVGMSMGHRGTDVAREASDIVLLDDNFASIVTGIKRGRIIFANIHKAISYIISIHVPIAGLSVLPVFLKGPLILMPAHIVLLELIIDPVCSLMFESLEPVDDVMEQKPRELNTPLFDSRDYMRSLLQGCCVFVILGASFLNLSTKNTSPEFIRGFLFLSLILCNVALILADLTHGSWPQFKSVVQKKINLLAACGLAALLIFIFEFDGAREIFKIEKLTLPQALESLMIGFSIFLTVSFWNRLRSAHK